MNSDIREGDEKRKDLINLDKSKVLGLKYSETSQWNLREDGKRVLLYETLDGGRLVKSVGLLHPSEAVILALFNGDRTVEEIIKIVSYIFEESKERAEEIVAVIITKWKEALDDNNSGWFPRYDPKSFVMNAEKIDLYAKRLYKPLMIAFRLSDDCMRDCIYCNVEKRPTRDIKLLSLRRLEELADESKSIGISSITFSGGDPFIHDNIMQIISSFTSRNFQPFISTKAYISEKKAARLASLGIKDIQYSIDAPYPEVADFLTNSKGFFSQAIASIKNILKHNIKVSTNSILTSYNVLLTPSLVYFLSDLGVSKITLSTYGISMYSHKDEFFVDEEVAAWLEEEIEKITNKKKGNIDVKFTYVKDDKLSSNEEKEKKFKKRAICTASRWGLVVLSDGKVIPCDEFPAKDEFILGDVTNHSIMDVWRSPLNDNIVNPPLEFFKNTVCYECDEFNECNWRGRRCVRDSFKAFGSIYTPPPDCPKAPQGPRLY